MARIPINALYRGEGLGEKCGGILSEVFHDFYVIGVPEEYSQQTWIELLTVNETFLTAMKMAEQGDAFRGVGLMWVKNHLKSNENEKIARSQEETSDFWSCYPDLNRGPHPYQGCALPAEL